MQAKYLRKLAIFAVALRMAVTGGGLSAQDRRTDDSRTRTPIKHVVVIFLENVSFDHYFGTYPHAANLPDETMFRSQDDTPRADNLLSAGLLEFNPNGVNPFRIPPKYAVTCDEDHNYNDEQFAFHAGLMDRFTATLPNGSPFSCKDANLGPNSLMGYYDGNTATAIWNYAQYFAMSDNSFGTTFGPSTPGALNLISGNTFGATLVTVKPNGSAASASGNIANGAATGAVIGDPRPGWDDCVLTTPGLASTNMITVTGKNVGDLLNAKGLTWGWFQGGFAPTGTQMRTDEFGVTRAVAVCGSHHTGLAGDDAVTTVGDYISHHEPFEYYAQSSPAGKNISWKYYGDQWDRYLNDKYDLTYPVNAYCNICNFFQYSTSIMTNAAVRMANLKDTTDLYQDIQSGDLPAVSFVKPSGWVDGHPASSKLDLFEGFVKKIVGAVKANPTLWQDTAIFVTFDEGGGYYDSGYVQPPDFFGDGTRIPMIVVSPYTKAGHISHDYTDHVSILKFIERNWGLEPLTKRSRDNLPNPKYNKRDSVYVPVNGPAIGDLFDFFNFAQ